MLHQSGGNLLGLTQLVQLSQERGVDVNHISQFFLIAFLRFLTCISQISPDVFLVHIFSYVFLSGGNLPHQGGGNFPGLTQLVPLSQQRGEAYNVSRNMKPQGAAKISLFSLLIKN